MQGKKRRDTGRTESLEAGNLTNHSIKAKMRWPQPQDNHIQKNMKRAAKTLPQIQEWKEEKQCTEKCSIGFCSIFPQKDFNI